MRTPEDADVPVASGTRLWFRRSGLSTSKQGSQEERSLCEDGVPLGGLRGINHVLVSSVPKTGPRTDGNF
ncbi:Fibrillin-2 [Manis pentadactyla]|nr:Fibrillin-2 [Manis pentadactyla]